MRTNVYTDASNLFYGVKSLEWSIVNDKLFRYLTERCGASKVYNFERVEIYDFPMTITQTALNSDKIKDVVLFR